MYWSQAILLIAVVGVIAGMLSIWLTARRQHAWQRLARRMRLHYLADGPRVVGTLQGRQFELGVEQRGSDTGVAGIAVARMSLELRGELPRGLRLHRAVAMEGLADQLLEPDSVTTGDAQFDGQVALRGSNANEVLDYLTPRRRAALLALIDQESGEVEIEHGTLSISEREMHSEPRRYRRRINAMLSAAQILDASNSA